MRHQIRCFATIRGLDRFGGDRQSARFGFQRAWHRVSTGAHRTADPRVTDLHARHAGTLQDHAVVNASATDAGARKNADRTA